MITKCNPFNFLKSALCAGLIDQAITDILKKVGWLAVVADQQNFRSVAATAAQDRRQTPHPDTAPPSLDVVTRSRRRHHSLRRPAVSIQRRRPWEPEPATEGVVHRRIAADQATVDVCRRLMRSVPGRLDACGQGKTVKGPQHPAAAQPCPLPGTPRQVG